MNLVDIIRTRELPYAGTVVVQKGQMVRSDEIVAEMNFYLPHVSWPLNLKSCQKLCGFHRVT